MFQILLATVIYLAFISLDCRIPLGLKLAHDVTGNFLYLFPMPAGFP